MGWCIVTLLLHMDLAVKPFKNPSQQQLHNGVSLLGLCLVVGVRQRCRRGMSLQLSWGGLIHDVIAAVGCYQLGVWEILLTLKDLKRTGERTELEMQFSFFTAQLQHLLAVCGLFERM